MSNSVNQDENALKAEGKGEHRKKGAGRSPRSSGK
jgi:hypothetical protein